MVIVHESIDTAHYSLVLINGVGMRLVFDTELTVFISHLVRQCLQLLVQLRNDFIFDISDHRLLNPFFNVALQIFDELIKNRCSSISRYRNIYLTARCTNTVYYHLDSVVLIHLGMNDQLLT